MLKKGGWSRHYQKALRQHLAPGPRSTLQPALRLGRQAVALGLETLDLALIHAQALMVLISSGGSSRKRAGTIARAKRFFAEAIVPIEKTHRAALQAGVRVNQLAQTLRRRTAESSTSTRNLERSIIQRQAAEAALELSGEHRLKLLQKSRRLQKRLRDQTRAVLSSQESARQKNSHQLHDEIAQTLLAIDVRLLTLKRATHANTATLKKEIAETQRMVKQSAKTIHRLAHEFGAYHGA